MNSIAIKIENSSFKFPIKLLVTFSTLIAKCNVNYLIDKHQLSQCNLNRMGLEKQCIGSAPKTITLTLRGELDKVRSVQVQNAIMAALSSYSVVELNMKEVSLIDTSGLAIFINLLRKARMNKKHFKLAGMNAQLIGIFKLNRIDRIFNL